MMQLLDKNEDFVVIFDLDRTIVELDTPSYLFRIWSKDYRWAKLIEKLRANLPISRLRRRLEYWYINLIPIHTIENTFNNQEIKRISNQNILSRINRYKKLKIKVIIVTAAPKQIAEAIAKALGIESISSKVKGILISHDLQGNKINTYKEVTARTITIYSDQEIDFSKNSRKNYLVTRSGKIKVFRYHENIKNA